MALGKGCHLSHTLAACAWAATCILLFPFIFMISARGMDDRQTAVAHFPLGIADTLGYRTLCRVRPVAEGHSAVKTGMPSQDAGILSGHDSHLSCGHTFSKSDNS